MAKGSIALLAAAVVGVFIACERSASEPVAPRPAPVRTPVPPPKAEEPQAVPAPKAEPDLSRAESRDLSRAESRDLSRAESREPAPPAQAAQDGKAGFKLGVVNLLTCFDKDKYERVKDVDAELQKLADEFTKSVQEIEKEISKLKGQMESLKPSQDLYQDKRRQLALKETELKFTRELGRARFLDKYTDVKRDVYNEIRRVVSMVADEQKFDLVLRVEQPQLEEQERERDLSFQIASRVVLYAHPNVDITPLVIERLNQEYKKQKVAAGAGAAEWECVCKHKNKTDTCEKCGKKRP